MKYGMNLLLWTSDVNEDRLSAAGADQRLGLMTAWNCPCST